MGFIKTEEYTYVTAYFIIVSICRVLPFCFKKTPPLQSKLSWHFYENNVYLFSKKLRAS